MLFQEIRQAGIALGVNRHTAQHLFDKIVETAKIIDLGLNLSLLRERPIPSLVHRGLRDGEARVNQRERGQDAKGYKFHEGD